MARGDAEGGQDSRRAADGRGADPTIRQGREGKRKRATIPLARAPHSPLTPHDVRLCLLYKQVGLERKEFLRMCRETVQQGGPSNRELLAKLQRLGSQLQIIDERLKALEKAHGGGGGARRQGGGLQVESLDPGEGGGGALHNGGRDVS